MNEAGGKAHWDQTYASRSDKELSWYEAKPTTSLRIIKEACPFP